MSWLERKPNDFLLRWRLYLLVLSVTNNNANLTFWIVVRGSDLVAHSCPSRFWVHRYCKGNWKSFAVVDVLIGKETPWFCFMLAPLIVLSVTNNNPNLTFWIVERGSDLDAHGCPSRFSVDRYCKRNWKGFYSRRIFFFKRWPEGGSKLPRSPSNSIQNAPVVSGSCQCMLVILLPPRPHAICTPSLSVGL